MMFWEQHGSASPSFLLMFLGSAVILQPSRISVLAGTKQCRLSRWNLNLVIWSIIGKLGISIPSYTWTTVSESFVCLTFILWMVLLQDFSGKIAANMSWPRRNCCFNSSIFCNPSGMLLITLFLSFTRNDNCSVGLSLYLY